MFLVYRMRISQLTVSGPYVVVTVVLHIVGCHPVIGVIGVVMGCGALASRQAHNPKVVQPPLTNLNLTAHYEYSVFDISK